MIGLPSELVAPDRDWLEELASLLARGFLRLILRRAEDPPTPDVCASCGGEDSALHPNTPLYVAAQESVHCGNVPHCRKRAGRRPDRPSGRDPGDDDGPAQSRVPAPLGAPDRLVESRVVAPEGQLADPGEPASGPRQRRTSDAHSGGQRSAAEPSPRRADSGPTGSRRPGPTASTIGRADHPRLSRSQAHRDRARPGV